MKALFYHRMLCIFKSIWRRIYTRCISFEFKSCGKNCRFDVFDYLFGTDKISIGDNVIIGKNTVLEVYDKYGNEHFDPHLSVGSNTKIGPYSHISCVNKIFIGNDVLIGRRVFITDNSHGQSLREQLDMNPDLRPVHSKGPVIIGDYVWIGEGACILPDVTIGQGSIVGANAVVTKSVPAYCVAAGNPARIIRQL